MPQHEKTSHMPTAGQSAIPFHLHVEFTTGVLVRGVNTCQSACNRGTGLSTMTGNHKDRLNLIWFVNRDTESVT